MFFREGEEGWRDISFFKSCSGFIPVSDKRIFESDFVKMSVTLEREVGSRVDSMLYFLMNLIYFSLS